jgi:hypothetical protein
MDAVYEGANWTRRRAVAIVLTVMAVALLAGGLGGYLFRGASTLVVAHALSAPVACAPLTQPYFGTARTSAGFIPGL